MASRPLEADNSAAISTRCPRWVESSHSPSGGKRSSKARPEANVQMFAYGWVADLAAQKNVRGQVSGDALCNLIAKLWKVDP